MAGYFQKSENYYGLFIFATLGNFSATLLALIFWKSIVDLTTPLLSRSKQEFRKRLAAGIAILVALVPVVWVLLQWEGTENLLKLICLFIGIVLVYLTLKHEDAREKNNMWAYLIFALASLLFWSLYQMAPSGLQLFAVNNVDLHVWGYVVAPQWIQDINTVVVVFGGPLLSVVFARLRDRGWNIDIPKQFSSSLIFMGAGFLVLPLGISMAGANGLSSFFWLFLSYVLQSIGELLISPVGYAMVGKLAPQKYQGIMMGTWMLLTGLASLFSGDFSRMVPEPSQGSALTTNADYSRLFSQLGWSTLAVGVLLVLMIPFLRKLIRDKNQVAAV